MFERLRKTALAVGATVLLSVGVLVAVAGPASAYGRANWQVTFSGTGTFPGGGGFGFWGWCDFAGGTTAGNNGDCEFAQYNHAPSGSPAPSFTCHESLDVTSWDASGGTFVVTGTATVTPSAQTANCLSFFPGSSPFSGVNSGLPAVAGHHSLGVNALPGCPCPGAVGEYNVTVAEIP
jgi:hypothetical protein